MYHLALIPKQTNKQTINQTNTITFNYRDLLFKKRLLKQIEFYFSDSNAKDKWLRSTLDKDPENYLVCLSLVHRFFYLILFFIRKSRI